MATNKFGNKLKNIANKSKKSVEELHIKGVDQVSIEYRRWLLELASSFTPES